MKIEKDHFLSSCEKWDGKVLPYQQELIDRMKEWKPTDQVVLWNRGKKLILRS